MAILIDSKKTPSQQTPPAAEAAAAHESDPLLPPAYHDDRQNPDVEHGTQRLKPKRQGRSKYLILMLALVGSVLATAGVVSFAKKGRAGSGADWMAPPSSDRKSSSSMPSLNTLPPYSPQHTHDHPHPSWPGTPLYSVNASYHLPLASSNPAYFLHAFGEDATGSVTVLTKDGKSSEGVDVSVQVVYADVAKLKERVRIWQVEDDGGRHGVDIMTPRWNGIYPRRASDYIRIHVVLHVPSGVKDLSFDGDTSQMSLAVAGADDAHPIYKTFDFVTRNSPIELETIEAETVRLTTTNAPIALSPSPNAKHALGLQAVNAVLTTTNAPVRLDAQPLSIKHKLTVKSTSGKVSGPTVASEEPMDELYIVTTNQAIEGQWSAKDVSVKTTNGAITATFTSVEKALSAITTNQRSTINVGLSSSASTVVPIKSHTTNAALSLSFLPSLKNTHTAVNVEVSTTNQQLSISAPDFAGPFELSTSNAGVSITGERVEEIRKSGSTTKGYRRGLKGKAEEGKLVGRTTNGGVTVAF